MENLIGKKFGKLLIVGYAGKDRHDRHSWDCICDCGNKTSLATKEAGKHKKSCGCLRASAGDRTKTHGMSHTPIYKAWFRIKQRCYNSKRHDFNTYGGRGIRVCERWLACPENFISDMGPSWKPGLTIGRIDSNGHYDLNNCRWETTGEQARSRRNNTPITHNGITKVLTDWATEFGMTDRQLRYRINSGWSFEEATSTPINHYSRS